MDTKTPVTERLAILERLREKWTLDLYAAIGVNPDVAAATAEALELLASLIDALKNTTREH